MSRIGKKPIPVPGDVKVDLQTDSVQIAKGAESLTLALHPSVEVKFDAAAKQLVVTRKGDERIDKAMHGTTRAHLANMIQGVTQGFAKNMAIYGTGYNVKQEGANLVLAVGFAKPAARSIPKGIKVEIKVPATRGNEVPALFTIRGADKGIVGQFAAEVRNIRPPEPYKGKGVRYAAEVIKKKAGKAFTSGG